MSGRVIESIASFRGPVVLKGVDRTLPAGAYRIVTEEAAIDGLSFPAYRRISIAIIVPIGDASEELATIDARDLEAALERDRLAYLG